MCVPAHILVYQNTQIFIGGGLFDVIVADLDHTVITYRLWVNNDLLRFVDINFQVVLITPLDKFLHPRCMTEGATVAGEQADNHSVI